MINLCEMKYSGSEFTVTSETAKSLNKKISDFRTVTGTKYAIYPTLITTYGLVDNSFSDMIQSTIVMDDLFAD